MLNWVICSKFHKNSPLQRVLDYEKILLFTDSLGAGGAQRQLVGLAKMLTKLGYNITVATYFNLDFYKSQLDDAGIRNVLIPNADDEKNVYS